MIESPTLFGEGRGEGKEGLGGFYFLLYTHTNKHTHNTEYNSFIQTVITAVTTIITAMAMSSIFVYNLMISLLKTHKNKK